MLIDTEIIPSNNNRHIQTIPFNQCHYHYLNPKSKTVSAKVKNKKVLRKEDNHYQSYLIQKI